MSKFATNNTYKYFVSFKTIFFLFFSISCSEQSTINSYIIPSEYEGSVVCWKLPQNWAENPELSGPMAGSFHIVTKDGKRGRIGVMPFRESVSNIDVANMFSREMSIPSFNDESIKSVTMQKQIGDRIFDWILLEEPQKSTSTKRTALLALLRQENETWLFPFIADQKLVNKETDNFVQFLKSCTLRSAKNKPIVARSPVIRPSQGNVSEPTPPNPWLWNVPTHWQVGKKSSMRVGSFKIETDSGQNLDISITTFPGDVGGLLANVNRWIGQINLPPVDTKNLSKYRSALTIADQQGHLIEALGEQQGLLAGVLFLEKESWFFKLIGDTELVEKERSNFLSFVKSIRRDK